MDACHLMKTVNLSYTDIQSFSVVHDSFGTHACDMEILSENLRTTFIEIYKEDVLKKFAEEQSAAPSICKNTFPKIPKYGKLNIKEVKDAEFFFS